MTTSTIAAIVDAPHVSQLPYMEQLEANFAASSAGPVNATMAEIVNPDLRMQAEIALRALTYEINGISNDMELMTTEQRSESGAQTSLTYLLASALDLSVALESPTINAASLTHALQTARFALSEDDEQNISEPTNGITNVKQRYRAKAVDATKQATIIAQSLNQLPPVELNDTKPDLSHVQTDDALPPEVRTYISAQKSFFEVAETVGLVTTVAAIMQNEAQHVDMRIVDAETAIASAAFKALLPEHQEALKDALGVTVTNDGLLTTESAQQVQQAITYFRAEGFLSNDSITQAFATVTQLDAAQTVEAQIVEAQTEKLVLALASLESTISLANLFVNHHMAFPDPDQKQQVDLAQLAVNPHVTENAAQASSAQPTATTVPVTSQAQLSTKPIITNTGSSPADVPAPQAQATNKVLPFTAPAARVDAASIETSGKVAEMPTLYMTPPQ